MKEFTSQVCTDRHQSQRLLEMGLKPETADMYYFWKGGDNYHLKVDIDNNPLKYNMDKTYIPAWSLHRLIEMLPNEIRMEDYYLILGVSFDCVYYADNEYAEVFQSFDENTYSCIIKCIEWLIKEGYFNKEYLKQ